VCMYMSKELGRKKFSRTKKKFARKRKTNLQIIPNPLTGFSHQEEIGIEFFSGE
jgi:hypothetical protein